MGNCTPRRTKSAKGREEGLFDDPWSHRVLGAAIAVHRSLGPGLLESAYQEALAAEFENRGIAFEREWPVPVHYGERLLATHYRIDFLVGGRIVVGLKATDTLQPVHAAQLLTYLRLGGFQVGLLLNFGQSQLRHGIRRFVNIRR